MTERCQDPYLEVWEEPVKKALHKKEGVPHAEEAKAVLAELRHAEKCKCANCFRLYQRKYDRWEVEDDRIHGRFQEDREERRLAIKIWKDMGYE